MINIYDSNFTYLGAFGEVSELKINDKVMEVGSFSFKVPYSERNRALCAPDNMIEVKTLNSSDVLFQGIIETCYIEKSTKVIEVSGNSIEVLLDWKPPYPRLSTSGKNSYSSCHFYNNSVAGIVEYDTRNIVFVNPLYDGATEGIEAYNNLGDLFNDLRQYFLNWYGLYIHVPISMPDIPDPTPVLEIPIANATLLEVLKLIIDRLYPDYYLKFKIDFSVVYKWLVCTLESRDTISLNSDYEGISNITYTNTTHGAIDYVYDEWELEPSADTDNATVLVTKEGKTGYNRREGGSMNYEFQAKITGWTTYTGTISTTDLMEVTATIRKGEAHASGDPSAGYVTCNVTPTVTFRRNNASGATIPGPKITSDVIKDLRSAGVTDIHVTVACANKTSSWGAPNYGGGVDAGGTKPSVSVKYLNVNRETTMTHIAYVQSPYIPSGRSQWFDKCLHKSESGYDKETDIEVKRARLNADNLGNIEKPSVSYEFVLESSKYDLDKGAIVTIKDTDFDETYIKAISEIEYIFTGEDYDKIYSLTDYIGGN